MRAFTPLASVACVRGGNLNPHDTGCDLAIEAVNTSHAGAGYLSRADTRILSFAGERLAAVQYGVKPSARLRGPPHCQCESDCARLSGRLDRAESSTSTVYFDLCVSIAC